MPNQATLHQGGDERDRAKERSLRPALPPTNVPGLEPERFLGAGAYGEVWVARNRNTGRQVAVKFYSHRGGLDWSLLSREVEKLSFLFNNRYVVQLLDVGWDADPPYYVMEYFEFGSLEDRLRQGPLPAETAVAMLREIATGLVHAHGKGVLHCDLKPANILLDQDQKPRLADFGQSRLTHEQTPSLGTLFYMAPEQADLDAAPDARWDVYALGAVFYTMLTGRAPHSDDQVVAEIERQTTLEDRLTKYRESIRRAGVPLTHRKLPGVDRPLAEIIERCLETNPSRRYPNPQAVLDALRSRAGKRARRPLLVLGAIGPALLLAVATSFAWSMHHRAERYSEELVVNRALDGNSYLAQFVAKGVANEIERRWQALERIAADPEFRAALVAATGQPLGSPPRRALQARIDRLPVESPEVEATSWFITDADGWQLARWPYDDKTVGGNYAFRDYFHGQGREIDASSTEIEPIRDVHRSMVFTSQATRKRMVAFSAPVWSGTPGAEDSTVLGVLAMTVELGHFSELRPEHGASRDHVTLLVDTKPDAKGQEGSVLEHPTLVEALRNPQADMNFDFHIRQEELDRVDALRDLVREGRQLRSEVPLDLEQLAQLARISAQAHHLAKVEDFADPVEDDSQPAWLAAIEPVFVDERSSQVQDTGWAVIVQERRRTATLPVREMGRELVRVGLTGLAVVLGVVTALWGFVIIVLNESPRGRWFRWLRRTVGLSTEGRLTDAGSTSDTSDTGDADSTRSSDREPVTDTNP